MFRRPSLRALALAAVATLVVAAPATASAPALTIKHVNLTNWPNVAVTVQTPDPGVTPQLTVTENGQTAANVRQSVGPQSAVAVVIDTSRSMRGQKLTDAITDATTFVTGDQSSDTLGVYAFGAKPYISVALPATSAAAAAGLAALAPDSHSGTAIYGGISTASQALAGQHVARRAIVLVTDGSSEHDSATFAQAVAAAKSAHASIYAVSIASTAAGKSALRALAQQTGGEFLSATDGPALAAAYRQISTALGSTFTFTYHSLVPKGTPIKLAVSVPGLATAHSTVTAPGTIANSAGSGSPLVRMPTSAFGRAMVALGAAFLVLIGALLLLSFRPGVAVGKRIAAYTEPKRKATVELAGVDPTKISMLSQLFAATEKIAGSLNYWKATTRRLEQADLPLRTAEIVYIQMGAALLMGVIGRFALGLSSLLELLPLLLGLAIPALFVRFMAKRRLNAFEGQLPETLITLAASLKAGHAFNSALASVVKEGADPTSKELGRVAQEIQLGMTSEAALEAMAQRMNSTNFGFVVMAVNIQRTVGGSLAEILDMVADTVRQRQQFSRKVKALTAQGRMSAYVLLAMPFLMGLAIFALNPSYMSILFTSAAGKVMIAGSLVMMGIGSMIIRKIVSFEG
jgi:tight adherence protein B